MIWFFTPMIQVLTHPPSIMEDLIVGLLRHRGAILESNPLAIGTPSIRPLGRISEPPIGLNNGPARLHTTVWHVPDGWTILDQC